MMEKGDGKQRCLVRVTEEDAHKDYKGATLLHLAVLSDNEALITYLAPFIKECVVEKNVIG